MDRMTDAEFDRHVRMVMSMSTDFLTGGLKRDAYAANLRLVARKMGLDSCTCDVCRGFGRRGEEAVKVETGG